MYILMAFEEVIGTALAKACELDSANDTIHLTYTAKIVCNHVFRKAKSFTGLPLGCQKVSVPPLLPVLVNLIL